MCPNLEGTPIVSTPAPPDPRKTAQAQADYNQQTAQTTQAMNMVNQYNPWGTSEYDQTGTQTIIGADGKPISVPKYSQTTTLSPEQQAIFEQGQEAQGNIAGLAVDQSARMREYLSDPFTFDNQDAANWAYDLGAERLDPRFAQQEEALRTRLYNSGAREGSPAYEAAMGQFGQERNDAYNNLMLEGRGQAFSEAMAGRNQPINELSALMSGSQVSMPQFGATPQTGVGGVDYTGLVNQKYQGELASHNAMMGGLFGLAGTGMQLALSDERLKTNIRRVGQTDEGTPIYTYNYKSGGPTMMGVMAQEVPDARVMGPDGFWRVDYAEVS